MMHGESPKDARRAVSEALEGASALSDLDEQGRNLLVEFALVLADEGARIGGIGIRDPVSVAELLVLESLALPEEWRLHGMEWLVDVGSGCGIPGVPLSIVMGSAAVRLLESSHRKADFLRRCVEHLGLHNVEVLEGRAEDIGRGPEWREKFDLAVTRGAGRIAVTAEYLLPLVRVGGMAVMYKGRGWRDELDHAASGIKMLGGEIGEARIPIEAESRYLALVSLGKARPTPARFPRRVGVPQKTPLGT
ncbi:MAG: 16S rRNA (guanine(527)-N(7))-methyltransferase RsmG [Armatimonadetes bacterium]|nr:16S rRNA (guanine(527)-N(7))-methyltransferase RsmG [Armatimonadota bacterium]